MSAPRTMYRVYWDRIDPRPVLRTTDKFVFFVSDRGAARREARTTFYTSWHESWEEAHAFIVDRAEKKIASLRLQLKSEEGRLGNLRGMKPPAGAA